MENQRDLMANYPNGEPLGSCFPDWNSSYKKEDEDKTIDLCEESDNILKEIQEEITIGGLNVHEKPIDSIIKKIRKDYSDYTNIIYEENEQFSATTAACKPICLIICSGDWTTSIGFENRLRKYGLNYWLQCYSKNKLTIFLTPAWEPQNFRHYYNEYIQSYESDKNHKVAIFMYDVKGLFRKYPVKP